MASVGIFLVTLAVGYWVLTLAATQERPLFGLGRIVGGLIMLASVAALVCAVACGICKMKSGCGMGAMMCATGSKMACSAAKEACPMSKAGANAGQPTTAQ